MNEGKQPAYYTTAPTSTTKGPNKRTLPFGKKDKIFALLILIVSIFMVDSVIFSGYNLGFSLALAATVATSAIYCFNKAQKTSAYSIFCLISSILIGFSFTIYNDAFVTFCGTVLILILFATGLLGISKENVYDFADAKSIIDTLKFWFVLPYSKLGITASSFLNSKGKSGKGSGAILLGIFCAIPVLFIVFPLLVSSDAAFEGFLDNIFSQGNSAEIVISLILGILVFVLLFALLFGLAKKDTKGKEVLGIDGPLPSGAVTGFLCVIASVYVLYMVSQLTYFFNAFWGILPKDYSFSDYARRGFFEMCAICFINLAIIISALALVKKKEETGNVPTAIKAVTTFIGSFSFLLTVTAMSKMFMYMDAHGLTRKRIITSVFMVIMLIILALTLIKIFVKNLPLMKIAVVAVTIIGLAVCFVDIDLTVAGYNTKKYLAGEITTDSGYLSELSDSAVPYIIELAKTDNDLQEAAKKDIRGRAQKYFVVSGISIRQKDQSFDLQGYNYTEQRAKELIWENSELFFQYKFN